MDQIEADNWFLRNKDKMEKLDTDPILELIKRGKFLSKDSKVLELGCSNGWRLNEIKKTFNCECVGIDISKVAIQDGKERFKDVYLDQSDISSAVFPFSFDLVILGFCLYTLERSLLFRLAHMINYYVKNEGLLIIWDFYAEEYYKKPYDHDPRFFVHKQDYSKMFTWNPIWESLEFTMFKDTTMLQVLRKKI